MGVNTFKTKFSNISKYNYMFSSVNYFLLSKKNEENKYFQNIRIGEYFDVISGYAFSSNDYIDQGILLCRIGDISKDNDLLVSDMLKLPEEYIEIYEKYRILENDILLGLTGDGKYFKTCLVTINNPIILLNQRVCILRLKNNIKNISLNFIAHLFKTNEVQNQIKIVAMGKTQKNVSPYDILNIKIPNISYLKQIKILEKITPLETSILELKKSKSQPINIINQVIGNELGFNWKEFEKTKMINTYKSSLYHYSNNIDCRMGIRFHNKAGAYIQKFLESKPNKRIKEFISEPIILGASVSPNDYDEEGDYYYIAMSNIKSWKFDTEDCKKVSNIYSSNNLNKTVKKDDIILARSGEGTIGKVAIIEDEDINGIFCDFTQRIRLTGYDPLCAYYYFRSDFFQYLVYTHKKGLGNNTNIFPSQIQELPIPDWSKTKQQKIIETIKTELNKQNEIDSKIEEKQNEINKIIFDVLNNYKNKLYNK